MKLTTHKIENLQSAYTVKADGKDTGLVIEKGEPAKYGMVQEWDVVNTEREDYLFSAKGKGACLDILQSLATLFTGLK